MHGDVHLIAFMFPSATVGAKQAVLEGGVSPRMVRALRQQRVVLCRAYLKSAALAGVTMRSKAQGSISAKAHGVASEAM